MSACTAEVQPKETFSSKLLQMEKDLISIVDRMNRDDSMEKALKAQGVLMAVHALRMDDDWFEDLDWDWEPGEEEQ